MITMTRCLALINSIPKVSCLLGGWTLALILKLSMGDFEWTFFILAMGTMKFIQEFLIINYIPNVPSSRSQMFCWSSIVRFNALQVIQVPVCFQGYQTKAGGFRKGEIYCRRNASRMSREIAVEFQNQFECHNGFGTCSWAVVHITASILTTVLRSLCHKQNVKFWENVSACMHLIGIHHGIAYTVFRV
jgi:hypothetical protein